MFINETKQGNIIGPDASDILNFETENSRSATDKFGRLKKEEVLD